MYFRHLDLDLLKDKDIYGTRVGSKNEYVFSFFFVNTIRQTSKLARVSYPSNFKNASSILYISISKFYLPKIKNNLDNRDSKIKEDLENANKFKEQSETKLKDYNLILEEAKIPLRNG